jgi:hypothetical protein
MSGTPIGGGKAHATNKAKYGEDFYAHIGAIGGKKSVNGGFASLGIGKDGRTGRERASIYGAIGGRKSRRSKTVNA